MSNKQTYIYRMKIGYYPDFEQDIFMYARNSKTAEEYCKEVFREKHYNNYKAIKVGISHTLRETGFISDFEAQQLIMAGAKRAEFYSERKEGLISGETANLIAQWNKENTDGRSDLSEDLPGSDAEPDGLS